MNAFNLKNRYQLNQILKKYNILKHSAETIKYLNKINSEKGCFEKYGVSNAMKIKEIAAKTSKTLKNRTNEEVKLSSLKAKITKLKLYENPTYNNRPKAKATCEIVFGCSSPMKTTTIKDKVKKTNLAKYGVENPFIAEEIKEKIKSTCIKKYGEAHYTQSQDYITKTQSTCQIKYGTNYYCQSREYALTAHKKYTYQGITFDSFWELALWIYAKDHNENIERCPVKLSYKYKGVNYYCMPDFKYNGNIIEVKGDQFIKNDAFVCPYNEELNNLFKAKQQCLLKNNVKIWRKTDIQFALDYVKNIYGKNYLKQFKKEEKPEVKANTNSTKYKIEPTNDSEEENL